MAEVLTFTRIYPSEVGIEHPATPAYVDNVLRSMNASANSDLPFKVLLRMDDGSVVVVKPKRRRPAPEAGER